MFLQILWEKPYGIQADYFSLGVMIYEMATRRHPYCTSKMTKLQVKKAIMEPVSEYPRDMDPDLRGLIMRVSTHQTSYWGKKALWEMLAGLASIYICDTPGLMDNSGALGGLRQLHF